MTDPVLTGVTVLDMTHAFAGPFCTYNLALLGADVIKVERPEGDDFRARPEVFASINAGKRSVTLDLRTDRDRDVVRELIDSVDVLVHNFRPDVPARLGVDWAALSRLNPRLIYVAISGYGAGPHQDRAAIEWAVQASSGLMQEFVDGSARRTDGWYPGISVVDPIAGYTAFSAILAALLEREKTGRGQYLDVAMMDAVLSLMGQYVANDLLQGPPTFTLGARLRTADGILYVAMSHQRWFASICRVIDAAELLDDPRFMTNEARASNYAALIDALERHTTARAGGHWESELSRAGVPASVVRTWAEAASDPSALERGLFRRVVTPWGEGIANAGGFRMGSQPAFADAQWRVPAAGEHTQDVLRAMQPDVEPLG